MSREKISIAGLNKADVLAALFNASRPLGMGFMHYDSKPMDRATAEKILAQTTNFDYLQGRVMKLDLSGDEFDPWGYDRDNGEGAAERALESLRQSGDVNNPDTQAEHRAGVRQSAAEAEDMIRTTSHFQDGPGVPAVHLGMSDVADHVRPKIEEAKKANKL